MAQANWFLRERLIEHILARPEPVVVLEAPAGMGKSVLLRQIAERTGAPLHVGLESPDDEGALALWDIPPYGAPKPLPESLFGPRKRIVIAKAVAMLIPARRSRTKPQRNGSSATVNRPAIQRSRATE